MIGACNSTDAYDVVQCTFSSTPAPQPCAANEWLVGSLSNTLQRANMSTVDTGNPLNYQHPFRSDIVGDTVAYLGSAGDSEAVRQTVVRVINSTSGALINFVYPRVAFFNRLDFYGSQKDASLYPVASALIWNATDVMLSYDASSIYIFFSYTYDFIAKCRLNSLGRELQPSDCSAPLSTAQHTSSAGIMILKGCVRIFSTALACVYDVGTTDTYVYLVSETNATASSKVLLESSLTVQNLRRPKSPPAWNQQNSTMYYIADLGSVNNEHAVRYVTLHANWTVRSSGYLYRAAAGSVSQDYHSLVYNGAVLLAADSRRLVSFAGQVRTERDIGETSIKGVAARGVQVLVLVHSRRMWSMYTHCAPCPANSFSPAGSTLPGINVCKCRQDFYGLIARYVPCVAMLCFVFILSCAKCIAIP